MSILDALFTGNVSQSQNVKIKGTQFSHTERDEIELAKAKYYSDTKSSKEVIYKQMVADK